MKKIPSFLLRFLLIGAIGLSASHLLAQDKSLATGEQESNKIAPQDDTSSDLTIARLQAAWETIEKDSDLEATIKEALRQRYEPAIAALKEAADNAAKANQHKDAITAAPKKTKQLNEELEKPSSIEAIEAEALKQVDGLDSGKIQESVDDEQIELARLNDELADVTAKLTGIKGRPTEIDERLSKAEIELSDVDVKLGKPEMAEDATSPIRVADRIKLQGEKFRLQSELEMLKQEKLSQTARQNLLVARESFLTRARDFSVAKLKVFETSKNEKLTAEAQNIGLQINKMSADPPQDSEARELAEQIKTWAGKVELLVGDLRSVKQGHDDLTARLNHLTDENLYVAEQLKLGGRDDAIAQILFEFRDRILRRGDNADITQKLPSLDDSRIEELGTNRALRKQDEIKQRFDGRTSNNNVEKAKTDRLLELRMEVLTKLGSGQKNLVSKLSALKFDNKRYRTLATAALAFVNEELFWTKSFSPVTTGTLAKLPTSATWVFQREHWNEVWLAKMNMAQRAPVYFCGFLLLIGLLLVMRGRIIAALKQTGVETRRISTDRFGLTVQALCLTLLLAAPISLMFAFLWWTLVSATDTSDWLRGVAGGLQSAVWITFFLGFVVSACRPEGLVCAHFGWNEQPLKKLRQAILAFEIVYVPALLLTCSTMFGTNATDYGESIGRISFIVAHAWAAIVLWRFFGFGDGVLANLIQRQPEALITRTRLIWFASVLGFPAALIVLAWRGYFITAIELSNGLMATLGVVAIGTFLYWMAVRWFAVKKRRLALAEAMEKRRARREAAAHDKAVSDEVVSVDADDELELDLDLISDQTRHLLQMVFGLCVVVAIAYFWSETIPIFSALEKIAVPLIGLSLLSVAKAVLIVVVTWIAVQNLPGLIELSVLRTMSIETGTRYAISRLCQYILTAIGLFLLFGVLQIDWTKFGWIAAALSVGLGFGLQEVVANFVCGLILLFERPVRVGDVVTLDNMTGTVTKVQMRATTITNWDRQEFIVPNKNLITGTILNWTLSAAINRIVIPVGVAYGSDTEKARQILLSVATDHPLILEDPSPSTTFEQFADSSLTIILRAYLPDLDSRLKTISELHTEINNRCSAEGVEIAFPQLDLHVRGGLGTDQAHGEFFTSSHSEP